MSSSVVDHRLCDNYIKKGYYERKQDKKKIQRFFCLVCQRYFSSQSYKDNYKDHKARINTPLLRMLCSGVSQRRCALIFFVNIKTVARKIRKMSSYCKKKNEDFLNKKNDVKSFIFDEMETFEHTKCKPLSIALSVEHKSRHILGIKVAQMPAKGLLSKKARKKYGPRKDERPKALKALMTKMKSISLASCEIKSDKNPYYLKHVKRFFPKANYIQYKGRRGCVVGYNELKSGGFDPLFFLNHSCAMIRDNIKRLSRRTWCTTKKVSSLVDLLEIYTFFHNQIYLKRT